jgi:hypothetical protein
MPVDRFLSDDMLLFNSHCASKSCFFTILCTYGTICTKLTLEMKKHTFQHMMSVVIATLLVTACSSPTRASQPAGQTGATDHPPVILRVEERQTTKDGKLAYYRDVYYSDAAGDAEIVKFSLLSGKLLAGENLPESSAITDSADMQRHEAVLNFHWVCNLQQTFMLEV